MGSFIHRLWGEIRENAKSVVMIGGTALMQTELTSFPGVLTAVKTALVDRTPAAYVDVAVQVLLVTSASMRAGKLVKDAVIK